MRRFWVGTVGGGYAGHGECFLHPQDVLWWSKGGELHGESPARIAFLRRILEEGPARGLDPLDWAPHWMVKGAGKGHDYCLFYWGERQPAHFTFDLPEGCRYEADVIDTWDMTVTTLPTTCEGRCTIQLPGRPYMAVRLRRV